MKFLAAFLVTICIATPTQAADIHKIIVGFFAAVWVGWLGRHVPRSTPRPGAGGMSAHLKCSRRAASPRRFFPPTQQKKLAPLARSNSRRQSASSSGASSAPRRPAT
jgi:hypothetical protein